MVLAALCNFVKAQGQNTASINIGDHIPDIAITNLINYPTSTARIADFKGKLLILDFWATWCSPCIAMIPKMDSLQKEFTGRIQFLPIAYQSQNIVQPFLEKLETLHHLTYNLPDAVGATFFCSFAASVST